MSVFVLEWIFVGENGSYLVFGYTVPNNPVTGRQMDLAVESDRLEDTIPRGHQVCEQWTYVFERRVSNYEIHRNLQGRDAIRKLCWHPVYSYCPIFIYSCVTSLLCSAYLNHYRTWSWHSLQICLLWGFLLKALWKGVWAESRSEWGRASVGKCSKIRVSF